MALQNLNDSIFFNFSRPRRRVLKVYFRRSFFLYMFLKDFWVVKKYRNGDLLKFFPWTYYNKTIGTLQRIYQYVSWYSSNKFLGHKKKKFFLKIWGNRGAILKNVHFKWKPLKNSSGYKNVLFLENFQSRHEFSIFFKKTRMDFFLNFLGLFKDFPGHKI